MLRRKMKKQTTNLKLNKKPGVPANSALLQAIFPNETVLEQLQVLTLWRGTNKGDTLRWILEQYIQSPQPLDVPLVMPELEHSLYFRCSVSTRTSVVRLSGHGELKDNYILGLCCAAMLNHWNIPVGMYTPMYVCIDTDYMAQLGSSIDLHTIVNKAIGDYLESHSVAIGLDKPT
jgi:hypothetical protein